MEVEIVAAPRRAPRARRGLGRFVRRLAALRPARGASSVAVCLVSDRRMRALNRRFRGTDRVTDVLSFAAGGPDPDGARHLGDIVIATAQARRQARARGHTLACELRCLALHGYLHLLGYDHETDDGRMLRLERRLARRLVPEAYARAAS